MELKVQIPFQQLLTAVKTLSSSQKARIKKALEQEQPIDDNKASFIEMLLKGPVFTEDEIQTIEENRKSIAKWRSKK